MNDALQEIFERARETKAAFHSRLGREWRLYGQPKDLHSPLVYAAFEFRCAIERCVIELFALIRNQKLSEKDLSDIQRFAGLIQTVLRSEGGKLALYRKLVFNREYVRSGSTPPTSVWLSVPDLGVLQKYWTGLSEYCHRQLKPADTWKSMGDKWVADGYDLLLEVENYLFAITSQRKIGWVQVDTLEPEELQVRSDYVEGRIDETSMKSRLELMGPIIRERRRLRIQ